MRAAYKIIESRLARVLALSLLAACAPRHGLVTTPTMAAASFVATSPNEVTTPPRNECWLAGRFHGTALLREREHELELVMPAGWVAVTRDNDKQWDELRLVVQVHRHPISNVNWPELTTGLPVILAPTVDSAGPQLTTWQAQDTLRLLVPWKPSLEPRWLVFRLSYRTLSHDGKPDECHGTLGTDTLRFR
ncbi:MAG TPA: hypothetical protein VH539_00750 [Gemmatimonadaceae bacterium]|jgi:hypothetical protein